MPAAPKSPQSASKKPGAPKAKGAVRAKSGCYTCRIRRKKCDERPNEQGYCETCVRLRLQCLGFGAKRPEWLRESRNVSEMRDKIKAFLAAQGMIKGHSGSGPRGSDHELPILRLEEDNTPSSSESPPTPTLSLSPSEPPRPLQHESSMREQRWIDGYGHSAFHQPNIRGGSPFGGSSHSSHHDMSLYPNYNSSNSLAPWNPNHHTLQPPSPALASSFSSTYTQIYVEEDMYNLTTIEDDDDMQLAHFGNLYNLKPGMYLKPSGGNDELINYYLGSVMDLQYLLGDRDHIRMILLPSVARSGESRKAARLLASIHCQRATCNSNNYVALQDTDTLSRYKELLGVLKKKRYTEDDALAAISIISSFLFDGGAGAWEDWLTVSYSYAAGVFGNNDPRDTLLQCAETTRFIVKTAIWFDVLAAVTTQKTPRFLSFIRQLYDPERSGVFDPTLPSPPALSMMSVMGCENHIVWALAEASALSVWKREKLQAGCLSIPELVAKASHLDNYLLAPTQFHLDYRSTTDMARELSSNIFRAATRVYLRSIVSGDYPHVPEIADGIEETMSYIRPQLAPKLHSSVVRSTVFAFFICGALTDSRDLQAEICKNLTLEGEDAATSTVGNSPTIQKLLKRIWDERSSVPRLRRGPVPWRTVLQDSNMLLV
ncbi:fungal-specific transcription factor domain-containing protein [Mycena rebaudengoi]|nr:fungal-specific transcription factor domain-containing protein [Mycena rebaudengoi]